MKKKTPKRKSSKRKVKGPLRTAFVATLSEDRILQLSNDLSDGIKSGNVAQWRAVALYFRNQLDRAHNDINAIRPTVAAYVAGRNILKHVGPEMESWLQRVKS